MAADYFQAGDEADSSQAPDKAREDESGEDMAETFLAPSSAFGSGCDVGDKYTVEVVSKHEDELELKHVRKKKDEDKEEKSETKPDEAHASIDAGIAKMGGY